VFWARGLSSARSESMSRREKAALLISWCVTTALGYLLAYLKWLRGGSVRDATAGGVGYALIMTLVHWVGHSTYKRQRAERTSLALAPAHKRALRTVLLQQALVVLLAALTLDGGLLFQEAGIAVLAYWVAWSVYRMRAPGRADHAGYSLHSVRLPHHLRVGNCRRALGLAPIRPLAIRRRANDRRIGPRRHFVAGRPSGIRLRAAPRSYGLAIRFDDVANCLDKAAFLDK
jgi:hypothetical protein